jgi:hypothetical protein
MISDSSKHHLKEFLGIFWASNHWEEGGGVLSKKFESVAGDNPWGQESKLTVYF